MHLGIATPQKLVSPNKNHPNGEDPLVQVGEVAFFDSLRWGDLSFSTTSWVPSLKLHLVSTTLVNMSVSQRSGQIWDEDGDVECWKIWATSVGERHVLPCQVNLCMCFCVCFSLRLCNSFLWNDGIFGIYRGPVSCQAEPLVLDSDYDPI